MSMFSHSIFLETMENLQKNLHANSKDKGFWEGPDNQNIPTKLMLIVSEVAEAMEAHRVGNPLSTKLHADGEVIDKVDINKTVFAEEMADVVIRVMDLCEHMGIELGRVILAKANYNKGREKMHGGKKY